MLYVAIIGAGTISSRHIESYQSCRDAKVVAIADINEAAAKAQAQRYGIGRYCTDYQDLLADDSIDAVSIVTPGFTHAQVVKDALSAGKHVLCEKPPCLNAKDAEECVRLAQQTGKLLMWAFVCRFASDTRFLKDYIQAGSMGHIYYAEAARIVQCSKLNGWFLDKTKSGGAIVDGVIHEIDKALYLMDYPKPTMVCGFTSHANKDMPDRIKGLAAGYQSVDTRQYPRTVESMASGYVLFENGACLYIKASYIMHSVTAGTWVELTGKKAGARTDNTGIKLLTDSNNYLLESQPILTENEPMFHLEVSHFVDCCINGTPCICPAWQGAALMRIIDAIYEAAETGKPVIL